MHAVCCLTELVTVVGDKVEIQQLALDAALQVRTGPIAAESKPTTHERWRWLHLYYLPLLYYLLTSTGLHKPAKKLAVAPVLAEDCTRTVEFIFRNRHLATSSTAHAVDLTSVPSHLP